MTTLIAFKIIAVILALGNVALISLAYSFWSSWQEEKMKRMRDRVEFYGGEIQRLNGADIYFPPEDGKIRMKKIIRDKAVVRTGRRVGEARSHAEAVALTDAYNREAARRRAGYNRRFVSDDDDERSALLPNPKVLRAEDSQGYNTLVKELAKDNPNMKRDKWGKPKRDHRRGPGRPRKNALVKELAKDKAKRTYPKMLDKKTGKVVDNPHYEPPASRKGRPRLYDIHPMQRGGAKYREFLDRNNEKRNAKVAMRICVGPCKGENRPMPGKQRCAECNEKLRVYRNKRREKMVANNLCIHNCGRPPKPGRLRCTPCTKRLYEANKKRLAEKKS